MLGRTEPGTEVYGCRMTQGCQQPPLMPGSSLAGGSSVAPVGELAVGHNRGPLVAEHFPPVCDTYYTVTPSQ